MKASEAAKLVGMVAAYWPGTDLRDETAQLWEAELVAFDLEDGMEAARDLGRSGRFMPSLAEFTDAIREVRNDRLRRDRPALVDGTRAYYPFAKYLDDHPEMVPRVKALEGSWVGDTLGTMLQGEIDHGKDVHRKAARMAGTK